MLSCRYRVTVGISLAAYRQPSDWQCLHNLKKDVTQETASQIVAMAIVSIAVCCTIFKLFDYK